MSKIFLHTCKPGQRTLSMENTEQEVERIPVPGEYITTDESSPWYKVELVVHCAFEAQFAAEVYALEVDHIEEMKRTLGES